MRVPTESQLRDAIATASRESIRNLFIDRPEESFYYISLISDGSASPPGLSAWSWEALEREAVAQETTKDMLKWSYADSPYCLFGLENFGFVTELHLLRPFIFDLSEKQYYEEYALRYRAMESAMSILDNEGLFGTGPARHRIVIGAEVMPPDSSNVASMKRLNPPESLLQWMNEAAEY